MTRRRKLVIGGAVVLALGAGGVGFAQAMGDGEENVSGPEADAAKRAAVSAVGGGRAVGVERDDGDGAPWVLREGDGYRMWYWTCQRWTPTPGGAPHYNNAIVHARSRDGAAWEVEVERDGKTVAVQLTSALKQAGTKTDDDSGGNSESGDGD